MCQFYDEVMGTAKEKFDLVCSQSKIWLNLTMTSLNTTVQNFYEQIDPGTVKLIQSYIPFDVNNVTAIFLAAILFLAFWVSLIIVTITSSMRRRKKKVKYDGVLTKDDAAQGYIVDDETELKKCQQKVEALGDLDELQNETLLDNDFENEDEDDDGDSTPRNQSRTQFESDKSKGDKPELHRIYEDAERELLEQIENCITPDPGTPPAPIGTSQDEMFHEMMARAMSGSPLRTGKFTKPIPQSVKNQWDSQQQQPHQPMARARRMSVARTLSQGDCPQEAAK